MPTPSGRLWIAALCVSLWACGGGARSGEVELVRRTIGPEGGTVSVTSGGLNGLRIDVPTQAVATPTTFTVSEVTVPPALSPLPPGFAAFKPTIRITASPAISGRVQVTFPVNRFPAGADEVLSAFSYDDASAAWSLVLPRAASAQEVTVETGHFSYWRWGVALLHEAPGDSLAQAMAEWFGQTFYAALQAELQQKYDQIVTNQLVEPINWTNCEKILALGNVIGAIADGAAADLHGMLTQTCGSCDVSLDTFMSELTKYVQLEMRQLVVSSFVTAMNTLTHVNFFMKLVLQLSTAIAFEGLKRDLHCDYACLFDDPPPGMIADLATYYVAAVALVILDIGYRYDGCDASTSGAQVSAAFTPAR